MEIIVKVNWKELQNNCGKRIITVNDNFEDTYTKCFKNRKECSIENCPKIIKDSDKDLTIKISEDIKVKEVSGINFWKVGDRGIVTEDFKSGSIQILKGDKFIVKIENDFGNIGVEFEREFSNFHDLDGNCKDNHGNWLGKNNFKYLRKI